MPETETRRTHLMSRQLLNALVEAEWSEQKTFAEVVSESRTVIVGRKGSGKVGHLEVVIDDNAMLADPLVDTATKQDQAVVRSRSLIEFASRALPCEVGQDALDEWMDEIETAAEEGLPVRRRAISIVLRSMLVLAVRSRLPVRVRGGGR